MNSPSQNRSGRTRVTCVRQGRLTFSTLLASENAIAEVGLENGGLHVSDAASETLAYLLGCPGCARGSGTIRCWLGPSMGVCRTGGIVALALERRLQPSALHCVPCSPVRGLRCSATGAGSPERSQRHRGHFLGGWTCAFPPRASCETQRQAADVNNRSLECTYGNRRGRVVDDDRMR